MDWTEDIDFAKEMLDEYGKAMSVITSVSGAYNGTNDSFSTTLATYSVVALMKNPTIQRENGEFAKSDRTRLLIAAKGLPTNLDELDYHIVCGSKVWHPDTTVALKPGGDPILFIVDLK